MRERATQDGAGQAGGEASLVLVVDDSPDALRLLTDAIELTGASVLVALSGEEALSVASRLTPDIILMDAVMPGIGGFEATRRLKADPHLRHVPVIVMTGLSQTEHVVEGLKAGAVDYLAKPIAPDELLARIAVHLANAREAEAARTALDTAGRFLLAVDAQGRLLWATPQARRLLAMVQPAQSGDVRLPIELCQALRARPPGGFSPLPGGSAAGTPAPYLSFVGQAGEDEHLFRITLEDSSDGEGTLRRRFLLTGREAEIALWLARGKSNRDIADILSMSPRTVNKHLEAVFEKLGVENRASAAVLILRVTGDLGDQPLGSA